MKESTRVDLAELTQMFELLCARAGLSVSQALLSLAQSSLKNPESIRTKGLRELGGKRYRPHLVYSNAQERQDFQRLAAEKKVAEATLVRHLVGQELVRRWEQFLDGGETFLSSEQGYLVAAEEAKPKIGQRGGKTKPLQIQLNASEIAQLDKVTNASGFRSVNQAAVQIIRAFILKTPVLGQNEMTQIGQLNLSLLRIGNNLNQISRALNARATSDPDQVREITQMASEVRDAAASISGLLKATSDRWAIS